MFPQASIKHPAHRFISYLLYTEELTDEEITERIIKKGFPLPEETLKRLRSEIEDLPRDLDAGLSEIRALNLHYGNLTVADAVTILEYPVIRIRVESLLLGGHSYVEIAEILHISLGTSYTGKVINYYSHFFWDVNYMSQKDWEDYDRAEKAALLPIRGQFKRGDIANYGKDISLYASGLIGDISAKKALSYIKNMMFINARLAESLPLSDRVKALTNCAKTIVAIDTHITDDIKDFEKELEEFSRFSLIDEDEVLSLEEIKQGDDEVDEDFSDIYVQGGSKLIPLIGKG